jgi:nitroreductase
MGSLFGEMVAVPFGDGSLRRIEMTYTIPVLQRMIITVDPCIAEAQLMDCGIFLQTVMLLAEEEGLGSCPQGFWALWPDTVRRVLGIKNELVVVGLAIGYTDSDAIVNTVRQTRLPLDEFVTVYE